MTLFINVVIFLSILLEGGYREEGKIIIKVVYSKVTTVKRMTTTLLGEKE